MREAVADEEPSICVYRFGNPESLNNINISDYSPIITEIVHERLLPDLLYNINGKRGKVFYVLVGGIHPNWFLFIIIEDGQRKKEKAFASAQDALVKTRREGFECLFPNEPF